MLLLDIMRRKKWLLLNRLSSVCLFKTIRFNLHYFPVKDAIRFPAIIYKNVSLYNMGGGIFIEEPIKTGIIQIGAKNVSIISKGERTIWDCHGEVHLKGKTYIGIGSCISIGKYGRLFLGNDFVLTARSTIDCQKEIIFGNECLLSWDILIMDSDYHEIINEKEEVINLPKTINVGNHVWIGCRSTILKGSRLPDNTIVAAATVISNIILPPNTIVGGSGKNLRILKENVNWNK